MARGTSGMPSSNKQVNVTRGEEASREAQDDWSDVRPRPSRRGFVKDPAAPLTKASERRDSREAQRVPQRGDRTFRASNRRRGMFDRDREPFHDASDTGRRPPRASGTAPAWLSYDSFVARRLSPPGVRRTCQAVQRPRSTSPGRRSRQPPRAASAVETRPSSIPSLTKPAAPAQER
jgi:hypothetical protein